MRAGTTKSPRNQRQTTVDSNCKDSSERLRLALERETTLRSRGSFRKSTEALWWPGGGFKIRTGKTTRSPELSLTLTVDYVCPHLKWEWERTGPSCWSKHSIDPPSLNLKRGAFLLPCGLHYLLFDNQTLSLFLFPSLIPAFFFSPFLATPNLSPKSFFHFFHFCYFTSYRFIVLWEKVHSMESNL